MIASESHIEDEQSQMDGAGVFYFFVWLGMTIDLIFVTLLCNTYSRSLQLLHESF